MDSEFKSNMAYKGGALSFECDSIQNMCESNIENTLYEMNSAMSSGGALNYDSFKPSLTNVTYTENSSPYGMNIGSYPVEIAYLSE